jgi:uncharacterized glyoxalase superfamily protein PhnB/diketogulonate reductase-like aldo/keto reductase/enamine deaminase RidA (YjgF/YER057c/UK114 family)
VDRSLTRLGGDAIDLLQYHAWNYADPTWLETLFELQELKARGLIRHLGVTNFDTAHLRIAVTSGIDVVSNQVSYSLLDQRAAGGLGPFCAEHGVHLLAYGTLAGGWLTDRWLDRPEPDWERLSTWSRMKYGRFIRVAGGWPAFQRVLKAAASVAARHGVSIANVASRFILDQPGVAGVIIGARLGEREHIDETVRLFTFALTGEDRSEIQTALAALHQIPGDCGDEYRRPPFLTASGDLSHHLDSMPAPYETMSRDEGRTICVSGTRWETIAGFARAVRKGQHVSVSGTTATIGDRVIGGSDPAAQTHFAIDKIEGALQSLGATLADVIRTRVYVRNVADWEPVARAHGERFAAIQPANTLVGATLVGDEYLVEIEADAVGPDARLGRAGIGGRRVRLHTYLNYGGNCEDAFKFYEQHLGGSITFLMRHGEGPDGGQNTPPEWKNKVLHARMNLGGTELLGADIPPDRFQPMRSAYLTLTLDSDEEADRVFGLLAADGQIFMPMQDTFFASRFAMLRDRFGTSWMLLHPKRQSA